MFITISVQSIILFYNFKYFKRLCNTWALIFLFPIFITLGFSSVTWVSSRNDISSPIIWLSQLFLLLGLLVLPTLLMPLTCRARIETTFNDTVPSIFSSRDTLPTCHQNFTISRSWNPFSIVKSKPIFATLCSFSVRYFQDFIGCRKDGQIIDSRLSGRGEVEKFFSLSLFFFFFFFFQCKKFFFFFYLFHARKFLSFLSRCFKISNPTIVAT